MERVERKGGRIQRVTLGREGLGLGMSMGEKGKRTGCSVCIGDGNCGRLIETDASGRSGRGEANGSNIIIVIVQLYRRRNPILLFSKSPVSFHEILIRCNATISRKITTSL